MYIKKSVLIVVSVILTIVVSVGTVMAVNPFGAFQFEDFFKFKTGIDTLQRYYYQDIDHNKLVDGSLLGASVSLEDPYTVYMDKVSAENFMENIESDDYTGVGLYITTDVSDNMVTVVSPLAGSPAEKAGIVTGDKIVEVDEENVSGVNIDEVAAMMKGKAGSQVKLTVLKQSTGETKTISLIRDTIKRETISSKMITDRIGYIQITQFALNTYDEFVQGFNKLADSGMTDLIIDLRNNPGGYIEAAVQIADCFLDEGEIVYTLDKYGRKRDYKATEGSTHVKMIILTNEGTASASEVLLGAMKDYNLAKSIGEKTFGKGVTQIPYQFYDGSMLKVTDSRYYSPKGTCIDKTGIEPDIEIKMDEQSYSNISELSLDEDIQLSRAVAEFSK
jgi:carboxyl-terminal processing protease